MYVQDFRFHPKPLVSAIRTALLSTTIALAAGSLPVYAQSSAELDALKGQIQLLMQRISDIEKQAQDARETQAEAAELAATEQNRETIAKGTIANSFKIPGTNTSIGISGYIKGDLTYDVDADMGDSFVASDTPLDGSDRAQRNGHTRLQAKQSRLRVNTRSELDNGQVIDTLIEGDFYGQGGNESFSNSSTFRIRHAKLDWDTGNGTLTAGQTWTNFIDFIAYPSTVDFFGPAGKVFKRQGQLRWTTPSGFAISVENPETDGFGAAGRIGESRGGIGADELPDVVVAWRGGPGGLAGNYETAAVFRQLGVDGVVDGVRYDDSVNGWGVNLAGGWDLTDKLHAAASVTFGDGIGSYIINGFGNDVYLLPDGTLESVKSMSFVPSLKYDLTSSSSIYTAYGRFENDTPELSNGIETLQTLHLGYAWTPAPSLRMGVEAIGSDLVNVDGSGTATRLQFGVQKLF